MNRREQDIALYNSIIRLVKKHFANNQKALTSFSLHINKKQLNAGEIQITGLSASWKFPKEKKTKTPS
ncbi:MAG TPA: hypothetical protein VL728_19380 [Cyclobacteriaceae bacterium]|jgi:hypothetical protein|nr:hypothetical protein [Cyclobacteriaceae bacterium]